MPSESVEELTSRLREECGWADFVTFERQIEQWTWLVGQVEEGYDGILEEYQNDLDSRMVLQTVLEHAAPAQRASIERLLAPLDERFLAATEPADPPIWTGGWWAERRPRKLIGELREDLTGGSL